MMQETKQTGRWARATGLTAGLVLSCVFTLPAAAAPLGAGGQPWVAALTAGPQMWLVQYDGAPDEPATDDGAGDETVAGPDDPAPDPDACIDCTYAPTMIDETIGDAPSGGDGTDLEDVLSITDTSEGPLAGEAAAQSAAQVTFKGGSRDDDIECRRTIGKTRAPTCP